VQFIARMIRAAKLEPCLYEEVKTDKYATSQALVVVLLSSLAASLGAFTHAGLGGLVMGGLVALLAWYMDFYDLYNRGQTLPCIPDFGKSSGVMAYAWLCQRSWDAPRLWSHTRTHRDCISRYRRLDAHCRGYCSTAGIRLYEHGTCCWRVCSWLAGARISPILPVSAAWLRGGKHARMLRRFSHNERLTVRMRE
jgi:hypothetical protein